MKERKKEKCLLCKNLFWLLCDQNYKMKLTDLPSCLLYLLWLRHCVKPKSSHEHQSLVFTIDATLMNISSFLLLATTSSFETVKRSISWLKPLTLLIVFWMCCSESCRVFSFWNSPWMLIMVVLLVSCGMGRVKQTVQYVKQCPLSPSVDAFPDFFPKLLLTLGLTFTAQHRKSSLTYSLIISNTIYSRRYNHLPLPDMSFRLPL